MTSDVDRLLDYMDALRDWAAKATRPAYAETCSCGGAIEVASGTRPADVRRFWQQFQAAHRGCDGASDSPIRGVESDGAQ